MDRRPAPPRRRPLRPPSRAAFGLRGFLTARLRPGSALLLLEGPGSRTRLGDRMHDEIAEVAEEVGLALHRLTYQRRGALSAAVADVYRDWLRGAGKSANRLIVESGRLTDPWNVVRAGLVPVLVPRTDPSERPRPAGVDSR